jgi:hypothetical protein
MQSTLFILLFSLTIIFVVTQLILFVVFMRAFSEFKKTHNPDEEALKQFKLKSEDILRKSIQQANVILTDAQKKGVDILASEEALGQGLSEEYAKHLASVENAFKEQFDKSADSAEKAYNDFIVQVGHVVNERIDKNEKLLAQKSDDMIKQAEAEISIMTQRTQEAVKGEVDKQLQSVKEEIDEYKLRRMKMIDERIIQMLEDVIKVTLEKKLSLVEQSELVYRALEEAKRENAFK